MTARTTEEEACSNFYLPPEIWECIFKFFDNRTFKSFSIVSKEFLSLTNGLRCSVTITNKTIPFLSRLFHRFSNLTSLTLIRSSESHDNDFNALLTLISTFPNLSTIKSLCISNRCNNIPAHGLRALSEKMKNLTSFTCYKMNYIHKKDLFFIADCFPLLEELDLKASNTWPLEAVEHHHHDQLLGLPKLRKINLFHTMFDHQFIVDICKNCELLKEINVIYLVSLSNRRMQMIKEMIKEAKKCSSSRIPPTKNRRQSCVQLGRRRQVYR